MTEHSHVPQVAPDEPKTPMWLPALGAALFLIAGIWLATGQDPEPKKTTPANTSASAAADAGAPAPPTSARPAEKPRAH